MLVSAIVIILTLNNNNILLRSALLENFLSKVSHDPYSQEEYSEVLSPSSLVEKTNVETMLVTHVTAAGARTEKRNG